jgi:hypothetical protein
MFQISFRRVRDCLSFSWLPTFAKRNYIDYPRNFDTELLEGSPEGGKSWKLPDARDIRVSRIMFWLLRHGAERQGLPMRPDGYVRVQDLVSFLVYMIWKDSQ